MKMLYYKYLGPEILAGFDGYKYSCLDTSPLSNYVMHPFWNQVVKLCPRGIAPNLLTFIGFLCCVSHFAVTAVFDYHYDANTLNSTHSIPQAAWLLVSLFIFLAHTLDGIDGKQARRTGTSSPLGELFDHGCDSWSSIFIVATFYSVFGRNLDGYSIPPLRMYAIVWSVLFSFHASHWEKYITGVMYLPWSYDVAMVFGTLLYLITGIFGYEIYKIKLPGDQSVGPYIEAILYAAIFGMAFSMTLYNIYVSYRDATGRMLSFFEAMRPLVSVLLAILISFCWALFSQNDVFHADVRCFFLLSGTVYANMSCRLIVAQMSSTRSELVNYILLPLGAAAGVGVLAPGLSYTAELAMLYALTALVILVHVHYVTCVVTEMCDYLNIDCFRIKQGGDGSRKKVT